MELLGHVVNVSLHCLGTVKMLLHFTLFPATLENSSFSASLTTLVTVGLFCYSHGCGCEVDEWFSYRGLNNISLVNNDVEHLSMCSLAICIV